MRGDPHATADADRGLDKRQGRLQIIMRAGADVDALAQDGVAADVDGAEVVDHDVVGQGGPVADLQQPGVPDPCALAHVSIRPDDGAEALQQPAAPGEGAGRAPSKQGAADEVPEDALSVLALVVGVAGGAVEGVEHGRRRRHGRRGHWFGGGGRLIRRDAHENEKAT